MPVINSAFHPPPFLSFDDDDDNDFGDFEFASNPLQSRSKPQEDDNWGEFVSSPVAPKWEKPKGAIPLSIFGEEEVEEEEPRDLVPPSLAGGGISSTPSLGTAGGNGGIGSGGLRDLIVNLYDEASSSTDAGGGMNNDFDDDSWEFKDAFSPTAENKVIGNGLDHKAADEKDLVDVNGNNEALNGLNFYLLAAPRNDTASETSELKPVGNDNGLHLILENRDGSAEEESWDFKDAFSPTAGNKVVGNGLVHEATKKQGHVQVNGQHEGILNGSNFLSMSAPHNDMISDTYQQGHVTTENGLHPNFENWVRNVEDENWGFKDAFSENGVIMTSQGLQKTSDTKAELLTPSTGIQVESFSSSSVEPFEHTTSVLHIRELVSKEEQHAYVAAWSSMVLACAEELQHGAMIWTESIRVNASSQILSRGEQYFLALGEIYRVAEILRVSSELFKPWVLSDHGKWNEMQTCFKKCAEVWAIGLEIALKRICSSDAEHKAPAKVLLGSIKMIHELDIDHLQSHVFVDEKIFCRISLLPMPVLPDMKFVVWNGEHYCVKLANFWSNRISHEPPQLPWTHHG
ncbi:uncharacterized protein [Typha latifolia]|uniref:uncharacterized protein n=1 Tax=Typha latifolia TaxID=4733 RepID=UPI003C2C0B0B